MMSNMKYEGRSENAGECQVERYLSFWAAMSTTIVNDIKRPGKSPGLSAIT